MNYSIHHLLVLAEKYADIAELGKDDRIEIHDPLLERSLAVHRDFSILTRAIDSIVRNRGLADLGYRHKLYSIARDYSVEHRHIQLQQFESDLRIDRATAVRLLSALLYDGLISDESDLGSVTDKLAS